MPDDAFLAFLVLGALMIVADGQILYRSGKRYLSDVDDTRAGSQARLASVLFHLLMLGVLALVAVLDLGFGGGVLRATVGNLGVLLLLLAAAHAVTMTVLANMHETVLVEERLDAPGRAAGDRRARRQAGPVVAPVPGQRGRDPQLSPSIEDHAE
ncbi:MULTISPECIES: hypothetical protein [Prauserella salsuginis group]|uniref:Uncharacterized protein n=2 Tax=Prauserella salsuginis group TaxID=2893672 RepID=A0A839XQB3_9PSEU|nr:MULTISPECIES: hypothetical protein [Prauserella salsuginis group]MBB3664887.1 hypothetical protein [Prauserella sediminis]MCR3718356.1 hypothetical protein [Prauserella flava]MCR3732926.1 hypothetical protein [Prauserella salsuginis]